MPLVVELRLASKDFLLYCYQLQTSEWLLWAFCLVFCFIFALFLFYYCLCFYFCFFFCFCFVFVLVLPFLLFFILFFLFLFLFFIFLFFAFSLFFFILLFFGETTREEPYGWAWLMGLETYRMCYRMSSCFSSRRLWWPISRGDGDVLGCDCPRMLNTRSFVSSCRGSQREIKREARKRADRRRRGYERALDCLHVRLLPPLMGVCLVLTFVFVAAWLDGDLQVHWGRSWLLFWDAEIQ